MIARVAQMYHLDRRRQADIAAHLRISQATVSRKLKRAQEEGIVRTTVVAPSGTYSELEAALRSDFDLSEVIVVECSVDRDDAVMARIGEAAAHLLEATLRAGEIIGVSSWSETILRMVDNIHPLRSRQANYVVQTLGGIGDPTVQFHANQLTTRLAALTGAEARLLNAPGVAPSLEARQVLLGDKFVRETLGLFGRISLAFEGIGALEPSDLLARSGNIFTRRELSEIENAGGIGNISLRFFDAEGEFVRTALDDRVIGMTVEDRTRIDRVIALAGGQAKTEAIRGALRSGIIDLLITDKFTASRLAGIEIRP